MNEIFDWESEDARLVQEESEREIEETKAWIRRQDYLTALDEARWEFRLHILCLPIDEAETALEGLYWYETHFLDDLEIEQGWTHDLDTD